MTEYKIYDNNYNLIEEGDYDDKDIYHRVLHEEIIAYRK